MVKLQNYYVMEKNGLNLKAYRAVGHIRWLLLGNKMTGKRFVLLLLGFCFSINLFAESEKNYLYVHGVQSSSDKSFLLDAVDKITFADETMSVFLKGESVGNYFGFSTFKKITFTEKGVGQSEVEEVAEDGITLHYDASARSVNIESPLPILSVQIYNLQGFLVQSVFPNETTAVVSLESCPAGMYIVKVSNEKTKIIQKLINR